MSIFEKTGAIAGSRRPNNRCFAPSVVEQDDADPIVGLVYTTDYRAEEEYGIGDLYKIFSGAGASGFTMQKHAASHYAVFEDVCGLVLSTKPLAYDTLKWGDPLSPPWHEGDDPSPSAVEYASYYTRSLSYAQDMPTSATRLGWESVADLREKAKGLGISPLPRKKADLAAAIMAHPDIAKAANKPNEFPGWFHYGEHLVLRADTGPTKIVLEGIIEALRKGTFGMGSGSGPFRSGLFLHDTRDMSAGTLAGIKAARAFYDKHMKPVAGVLADIKDKYDITVNFLGKPSELDTGDGKKLKYWLNGTTVYQDSDGFHTNYRRRGRKLGQPYGWYTLDEVRGLKFVHDIIKKEVTA